MKRIAPLALPLWILLACGLGDLVANKCVQPIGMKLLPNAVLFPILRASTHRPAGAAKFGWHVQDVAHVERLMRR